MRTSHALLALSVVPTAVLGLSGCGSLIPDRPTGSYNRGNFLVADVETRTPVLTGTFVLPGGVQQPPKAVVGDLPAATRAEYDTLGKGLKTGIHLCTITFVVDEAGRPTQVQWTASNSGAYTRLMMAQVQRLAFEPAIANGKTVACVVQMNFHNEVDGPSPIVSGDQTPPPHGGPINGYYRM